MQPLDPTLTEVMVQSGLVMLEWCRHGVAKSTDPSRRAFSVCGYVLSGIRSLPQAHWSQEVRATCRRPLYVDANLFRRPKGQVLS